jgi:hypothetical protein
MPTSPNPPPSAASARPDAPRKPEAGHELAPEDFYMEGPNLVFTETYHLKRGYCCNSGCRHCPYRDSD